MDWVSAEDGRPRGFRLHRTEALDRMLQRFHDGRASLPAAEVYCLYAEEVARTGQRTLVQTRVPKEHRPILAGLWNKKF